MVKKINCIFVIIMFFHVPLLFGEDLTITTYYPSPYGSYNQLGTNEFEVGLGSGIAADSRNGIANFEPRITPTVTNMAGDLYYNSTSGFQYNDGSGWRSFAGSDIGADLSTASGDGNYFPTMPTAADPQGWSQSFVYNYTATKGGTAYVIVKGDAHDSMVGNGEFILQVQTGLTFTDLDVARVSIYSGHAGSRSFVLMGQHSVTNGQVYTFRVIANSQWFSRTKIFVIVD